MKRVLVILPWFPYPLNSGGNQAICNGIKAMAKYFDLYVLYIDFIPDCHKKQLDSLKKELGDVKLFGFWDYLILFDELKRKILGAHFDYKYQNLLEFRRYPSKLFKRISEIIVQKKIDCVQVEMFDCLPLVNYIPSHVKKVFIHHEIRFELGEQLVALTHDKKRFLTKIEHERNAEVSYLNKYDVVVTLSMKDKESLINAGVITNICESFAVVKSSRSLNFEKCICEKRLTFVGPEQHLPNKNGLVWFLDNCWGGLSRENEYKLEIIGNWSENTKEIITQKYKNVFFRDFVENLYDALKGSVMIVPIFEGSGIRMKILEAAQMGVPFVSSTIGNMGLEFKHDKHCYIADSAESFVTKIRMLENVDERLRLAKNAFSLVKEKYSMERFQKNRVEIVSNLMN